MDPVSSATLANVVPASARVGSSAPVTPASAAILANAALVKPLASSTQVDISPLGQYLSGVALSRRQLLALQGIDDEVGTPANPAVVANDVLVALAQQLSDSFAQLRASGVDAGRLAMTAGSQDDLAQRFALLSGPVTPGASEALAQNADALTQADLARIGIDLQNNRPVDVAALQAAFEADRGATLNILQQGTDVLAEVGAALTLQQGLPAAAQALDDLAAAPPTQAEQVVPADIAATDLTAATVAQAGQPNPAVPPEQTQIQPGQQELAQQQALAQRQLEVRQQLGTEDLTQGLQELRQQQLQQNATLQAPEASQSQLDQAGTLQAAQQLQQNQQTQRNNPSVQAEGLDDEQDRLQTERIARDDVETQRVAQETALEQQDAARVEDERVQELQAGQTRQAQLQQQVQEAADDAARAQLAASEAQRTARAATERAQSVAREAQVQLDAGLVTTVQAQQAQQNALAQQQAAQNAALAVQQPSSQDPAVAAAIAAYNINNAALNPGLMNRPLPASDSQRPSVAPVGQVTAATPLKELKPGV
ncbi:hypothetical protein [Janthinobacterium psychrotolerans]|uniref:Uncharacterized protein n=1 Tax=Janthinobacterium psychrotolerans TaxID=1747903 RepID=A0A1A7C6U7_9BURK|nr:hypothetical protein [Janthinobacterium psychrotolerans]OBV41437.1 hypothetical protein ASR47_103122 [Janthinobacterium psychrotolerans]